MTEFQLDNWAGDSWELKECGMPFDGGVCGSSQEWAAVADGMERGEDIGFRRLAIAKSSRIAWRIWCPRNSCMDEGAILLSEDVPVLRPDDPQPHRVYGGGRDMKTLPNDVPVVSDAVARNQVLQVVMERPWLASIDLWEIQQHLAYRGTPLPMSQIQTVAKQLIDSGEIVRAQSDSPVPAVQMPVDGGAWAA